MNDVVLGPKLARRKLNQFERGTRVARCSRRDTHTALFRVKFQSSFQTIRSASCLYATGYSLVQSV